MSRSVAAEHARRTAMRSQPATVRHPYCTSAEIHWGELHPDAGVQLYYACARTPMRCELCPLYVLQSLMCTELTRLDPLPGIALVLAYSM